MDFVVSLLTVIFIAVLIGTAFTFGAALLVAILVFSIITALFFFARQYIDRWLFVRGAQKREQEQGKTTITVIEAEYEDLSDKK